MKTTMPRTFRNSPGPAKAHPATEQMAPLAASVNQSPLVQAQLKLAEELHAGALPKQQQSLSDEINHLAGPLIIQPMLALKVNEPEPEWYGLIALEIEEYNNAWKKFDSTIFFDAKLHRLALVKLSHIEQWVYKWFDKQNESDLYLTQYGSIMKGFLNAVQEERVTLVDWAIRKNTDPPVANFQFLEKPQREHLAKIWTRLVKNQKIEGDSDFRLRVLADFSRLLETETGRTLVGTIVESGNALKIEATKPMAEGRKICCQPG